MFEYDSIGILVVKLVRYLSYFFCVLSIVFKKPKFKHLVILLFIELLLLLISIKSEDKTMLLFSLILLAAYHVDEVKTIKIWLLVEIFFVIITIIFSQIGIYEDYIFSPNLRARHSLGFEWASISPTLLFHCILSYVYVYKENISYKVMILFGLFSLILFILTDSKAPFIYSILCIMFFLFEKKRNIFKKFIIKHKKLIILMPLFCFLITFFITVIYDRTNQNWVLLNRIFSGRLWLQHNALDYFGYTLFGQPIELVGYSIKTITNGQAFTGYNYVDCSYIQILLYYGVMFTFILLFGYMWFIKKNIDKFDFYTVWIIIMILLISLTEPRLINFAYNPFPILFFTKGVLSQNESINF